MKKLILSFILITSMVSLAQSKVNFEDLFKPTQIKNIDWHKEDNFKTYQEALGKASLQEGEKYYYEVSGLKYPLSLHKKGKTDKIEKIYHRLLGQKISFEQIKDYLKENNFTQDPTSKVEDDFQTFVSPDKKIKLQFSKATKELYAVEKWF